MTWRKGSGVFGSARFWVCCAGGSVSNLAATFAPDCDETISPWHRDRIFRKLKP